VKTYVFPADVSGCGYYRLIWPSEVLRRAGYDVEVVTPNKRNNKLSGVMHGDTMTEVKIPDDADVIVLQRVTHRHLVQAMHLMRRRGVAVVVDFDDDLTCIHPANPAFTMLHPHQGMRDHSWENTLRAADAATLVTVSTPALTQRYGRRDHARVLFNMVPKRMLDVPRSDSDVVGWAGSVHSHPTDLQALGPSIAQHLQSGGRFRVAGPEVGVRDALGLLATTRLEATGVIADLDAWPLAVASLGIGVAPLADTKFNAAKSWLKLAEYAACGVPCVGSPRSEYVRINKLGVGQLAKNPGEWKSRIARLVDDAALREELSQRGRDVMRDYTIEGNAWRWYEVWTEALRLQRANVNPLARVV